MWMRYAWECLVQSSTNDSHDVCLVMPGGLLRQETTSFGAMVCLSWIGKRLVCFSFRIVAKNSHAAFVSASFNSQDDRLAFSVRFIDVREVRRRGKWEVVNWRDWAGWFDSGCRCRRSCSCSGCHGGVTFRMCLLSSTSRTEPTNRMMMMVVLLEQQSPW